MPSNILINGGGIAGPCLAFWLTRQGHVATITEQARQLRTGGHAVDFRGPSLVVLEKMGLLDQVRASATQMGPLVLVDERGKEIARLPAEVISGELEIFWGDRRNPRRRRAAAQASLRPLPQPQTAGSHRCDCWLLTQTKFVIAKSDPRPANRL
jgi:2-polyprenyl-6-methoxyphenol hydroxylase-like FAD-dependent oxidoreductase